MKKNITGRVLFFPLIMLAVFGSVFAYLNVAKATKLDRNILKNENRQKVSNETKYVPGEIIVKFKKDKIDLKNKFSEASLKKFAAGKNIEEKSKMKHVNAALFKTKGKEDIFEKINDIKKDPDVEYAEPNYRKFPVTISTNDPKKDYLWGLDNFGQTVNGTVGTSDSDIDAPEAWSMSTSQGSPIIVSIIDMGVAYNHPDLLSNMWNGSNCLDELGYPIGGCIHGYDFSDNDKSPLPSGNHGTMIAGIIGAVGSNGKGIIGVNPKPSIMAVKFDFSVASEIDAIDFSIENGAKIINASYASSEFSQAEYDAIESFRQAGGLFVAAAGNDSRDNDNSHIYPSDYDLDNIISVAATDQNDNLASFSNYGSDSVDVAAPGVNIYSASLGSSSKYTQNFQGVTAPALPSGWSKSGNWGTWRYDDGEKVLYGDLNYPYASYADTYAKSSTVNLGGSKSAAISFYTQCDTAYSEDSWLDYMSLEVSGDGYNFSEIFTWDEAMLDFYNGDSSPDGEASYFVNDLEIPSQYLTSNFKFRLRWITDGTDNNYDGCWVDDMEINSFTDGSDEKYEFGDGTSFAAPHVAGLASLLWSKNPNLSYSDVKSLILENGDPLASLSGKTVTGKRINAKNSMMGVVVAKPSASVRGGTYNSFQTVQLSTLTSGAEIYYTTDGTAPSQYSTKYTTPITINGDKTLKAIAVKEGLADSDVLSESYILILSPAGKPTTSVPAGTYTSIQAVSLSSATEGADIYYTTDGTAPTAFSEKYVEPVSIEKTGTLKAIAIKEGFARSNVMSISYTINLPKIKPIIASPIAGTYNAEQIVTLSTATPETDIYFTIDGTTPTDTSSRYFEPIAVSGDVVIKAVGIKYNYRNSSVLASAYVLKPNRPTPSIPAGTYTTIQSLTLSTDTESTKIFYTTDGTNPSYTSTEYTEPISLSRTQTIKAVAYRPDWSKSNTMSALYTINLPRVKTIVANPVPGIFKTVQTLSLSTATVGADIYYTNDGTTPTDRSSRYTDPIEISGTQPIKAVAIKYGMKDSPIFAGEYILKSEKPTASPAAGTYSSTQTVTLSTTTEGADIYFTTDGSTPTTGSTRYTEPILVSRNQTIKAISAKEGWTNSGVLSAAYTINATR